VTVHDAARPRREPETPIRVDVAMFGGPRAGKTSLLASMYRSVLGETRRVGLKIRRVNPETIKMLDAGMEALQRLPEIVVEDPTLMGHPSAVPLNPPGEVRRFDFLLSGAGVDVATLSFYDFSGEDIKDHADHVGAALRRANIILVAINTPAMMEAYLNPDYEPLHLDLNLSDQLDHLLDAWSGSPPVLVMLCPIKSERWLHSDDDSELLREAVSEMYGHTLTVLGRDPFKPTTVVLAPVETVGSVSYRGLERYDPAAPPTHKNVVFTYERRGDGEAGWSPHYSEQPFRWSLLTVTRAVDYGVIVDGKGSSWWQKGLGYIGKFWEDSGLPTIGPVEAFLRDGSGLAKFKSAADTLSEGRLLDSPYHLHKSGLLMEPVER
jgi:hypothetical protein